MATKNTDKAAIANLKETLRLVTAERDEWRRLSGEWQKRAEALRHDMDRIHSQACQLDESVKRLQVLMKS
jgi:predicted nuclease with TOPRIM domain